MFNKFGSVVFGVITGVYIKTEYPSGIDMWSNYWDSISMESKKRIVYK